MVMQLRAAAAQFEPTAHPGPKCGRFQAVSVWDHDSSNTEACEKSQFQDQHGLFYKGWRSHFSDSPVFETQAELDAWIAANPLGVGNSYKQTGGEKSIEHRENYSLGGGNYLGYARYSGWTVSSTPVHCCSGSWRYEVLHANPIPEPEVVVEQPTAVELYDDVNRKLRRACDQVGLEFISMA